FGELPAGAGVAHRGGVQRQVQQAPRVVPAVRDDAGRKLLDDRHGGDRSGSVPGGGSAASASVSATASRPRTIPGSTRSSSSRWMAARRPVVGAGTSKV